MLIKLPLKLSPAEVPLINKKDIVEILLDLFKEIISILTFKEIREDDPEVAAQTKMSNYFLKLIQRWEA